MVLRLTLAIGLIFLLLPANAQEVRTFIDLQLHPTMHVAHGIFGEGLRYFDPEGKEPGLTFRHQLKNVLYANYLENNEGARILVIGALTKEAGNNRGKARKKILEQFDYIRDFVRENDTKFAIASSPDAVRQILATTDKTIIIFSIEGAKKLVNSQADANFWADQGVAFITLIHLLDSELGTSAIKPGLVPKLINLQGTFRSNKKGRGLTEKGKAAIRWLANAGVMIDITHMSEPARADALDLMEADSIPPVATHDLFRPIQNHARGLTPADIIRIYQNRGFISLPISGFSLKTYRPQEKYQRMLDRLDCFCEGSVDNYKFTYLAVKEVIESNHAVISGRTGDGRPFAALDESEKVRFAIGFQSDFNGWLNHSRPRFGKKGCYPLLQGKEYEDIETRGMPHPGLLASQWRLLEREGVDLAPIKRSAEKFLQLWSSFLERKGSFEK